jgi:hypothetical protein
MMVSYKWSTWFFIWVFEVSIRLRLFHLPVSSKGKGNHTKLGNTVPQVPKLDFAM